MSKEIRKVAVLGSGVMGSGIACHLANCGIPCYMLDIVLPLSDEDKANGVSETDPAHKNKLAVGALEKCLAAKQPMAPLYVKSNARFITPGNFEDDLPKLAECDWVIEVVKEDLAVKKALFARIAEFMKPGAILTSNTSGLPISEMSADMSPEMKKGFFVTHFFNPVRHMKLLEFIVGEETDMETVKSVAAFSERVLGKGVVYGKDTPNFVANRIGIYGIMSTIKHMQDLGLRIDEIDAIAGQPMGRPKSAAFRTADLVGLDTFMHVAKTVYDLCPNDEERDAFKAPEWIDTMVQNGWLGNKSKQGFYKKEFIDGKKTFFVLDYKTLEYIPSEKPKFDILAAAKKLPTLGEKIAKLISGDDNVSQFAWRVVRDVTIYSCNRIPEIADDVVNVDNAMKWGFGWEMGPFETADAIGIKDLVKRIKADGLKVPPLLDKASKAGGFYKKAGLKNTYYDMPSLSYKEVPATNLTINPATVSAHTLDAVNFTTNPGSWKIKITDLRDAGKIIKRNSGATLLDMGDGVALLEFHSYKGMNPIDEDVMTMMKQSVDIVQDKGFYGLVIGNEGQNFSVGANLMMILMAAKAKNWKALEDAINDLQQVNMKMKYSPFPVVTAPFSMVLGGGCEVTMHGDAICAAAETYIGLVEVGVGVIPAGGGCKEYLIRNIEATLDNPYLPNTFNFLRKAFENIAMAKVAMNAKEAMELNILRPTDKICLNKDYLLNDAKQMVLGMHRAGYTRKSPRNDIKLLGSPYYAAVKNVIWTMKLGGYMSEHDQIICEKIGKILTGGDIPLNTVVDEQYILDLEREAFVSLCGMEKTQDRIEYMLKNNKPLRN